MKIAININGQFMRMTGIQHYVDSLIAALYAAETRHEITAYAPALWAPTMWRDYEKDGAFAWRHAPSARVETAGSDFRFQDLPRLAALPGWKAAAAPLDQAVLRRLKGRTYKARARRGVRRYDLLHMPAACQDEFFGYAAKRSVVTIYDMTTRTCPWAHKAENIAASEQFFAFAQKHSARVLTISEFSKADIVQHLGIPAERIDVTPLAPRSTTRRVTDTAQLKAALDGLGLLDAPFVLYSGSLEPRKNLFRLVDAFAEAVADARLSDHKLVLAGGAWGRHDRDLHARAEELGVGERLVTPGYVSNAQMNALMSACEAFAYISEYEGFGMPPLEAMVCGAPVIASNTTSLPEVVGDAGTQVDPTDVEQIAAALHLLLTDCGENARCRELSLARAKQFSWERTAVLTLQSYEAALT